MINSLFPPVFPTISPAITTTEQPPADTTADQTGTSATEKTTAVAPEQTRAAHNGLGRFHPTEDNGLFQTAKHMIRNAFNEFRHDLRDSFRELGFQAGLANNIAKGVIHATRDALRTGMDFSAKLMVATISQTTSVSAAGASSSFSMVASSIEVNINHTTGSVDVKTTNVSIEAQMTGGLAVPEPHLVDMRDSDQVPFSALPDLSGILDEEEQTVEEPPTEPDVVATARESMTGQLEQSADTTTARTGVDAVLQGAATEEEAPVDDAEAAAAVDEVEDSEEDAPAEETDMALPEIATPLLLNHADYTARIFITAYEHSINEREERVTFMRFDAVIPLTTAPAATTDEEPVEEAVIEDIPVVDVPEEEFTAEVA